MREREANKKYHLEFGAAMVLYIVVLAISVYFANSVGPGLARTFLLLCPMVPVLLVAIAYLRHLKRMDEFVRLKNLESLAIAGGVTGLFGLTYGFLELGGFPKLSMFTAWMVFGGTWATTSCGDFLYRKFFAR